MDPDRFDILARSFGSELARRAALGGLLVGPLGLLGLADIESAAARACKKIKDKKKRKKCLAKANGPTNPPPSCKPASTSCGPPSNTTDATCCSGSCLGTGPSQPGLCGKSLVGGRCYTHADCSQANCVGSTCGKGATGALCTQPSDCVSGLCVNFTCFTCPSGMQFCPASQTCRQCCSPQTACTVAGQSGCIADTTVCLAACGSACDPQDVTPCPCAADLDCVFDSAQGDYSCAPR